MLIASLALSIGIAIFDLTERELELSVATTQSQYAIFAADTGAECALYWDSKGYTPGGVLTTAFATSSTYAGAPTGSNLDCLGTDITTAAAPVSWSVTQSGLSATTTFTLKFPSSNYCVQVTVAKSGNPSATVVTSNGFNTCSSGAQQLERTLQLNY